MGVELSRVEIFRVGIGEISSPELGVTSGIGGGSSSLLTSYLLVTLCCCSSRRPKKSNPKKGKCILANGFRSIRPSSASPLLWDRIMVESVQQIKAVQPMAAGKQRDQGSELKQDTPPSNPLDIRGDRLPSLESVPKSFNSFQTMPSDRALSVGLCTDKIRAPRIQTLSLYD